MTKTTPVVSSRGEPADDDFDDIEHELYASDREMSVGFDPLDDLDAFRARVRETHWAVPHRRLW